MAAWPADEDEDAEALPADRAYWDKDLAESHLPGFSRPGATFRGYRIDFYTIDPRSTVV
jgi:hypothetical protein